MTPSKDFLEYLMSEALLEAKAAFEADEVPIGAVIAKGEKIIGRGRNKVESATDSTSHAEMNAIKEASQVLNNWRLEDCVLAVTIEPCTMCAGAILNSRIPIVAFGAKEERTGAFGSVYDLSLPHQQPRIIAGVKEEECRRIIQEYFQQKRISV